MHALVTGAAGFLGQYIVEQLLARGDRVRAVIRRPSADLQSLSAECIQADLTQPEDAARVCQGIDSVFHAAGVAGIWGPWDYFYRNNTLATRYLIDGCRQHHVSRFVFTSSPSVTFDGSPQAGIDEQSPYSRRWLCHYPHTKALAEQEVLAANGSDGLLTCALRPHLIWGPRDRHLVPRLLERARQGRLVQVGDGTNMIDMTYVDNAAAAHLQACDALAPGSPVGGRAYFISQGEPVNCWQWINQLLTQNGLPRVRRAISLRTAWIIGAALEGVHHLLRSRREPRLTRFLAAQLGASHYFNITAARRDFGYHPTISTAAGMQRAFASRHF